MKKGIALLVCLFMIANLVTGCNTKSEETASSATNMAQSETTLSGTSANSILNLNSMYPITNEPSELSLVVTRSTMTGESEDLWWWKYVEKKTNIKLNIKQVDESSWEERKVLMFTSNELPDLFYNCSFTSTDLMRYGSEGSFIPLNDLVDQYAPQITDVFTKYPNIKAGLTCPDGNYYTLPCVMTEDAFSNVRAFINQSWMDKLGLQTPKTLDDFYNVLVAFKTGDPNGNGKADEIPWSGSWEEGYRERVVVLSALGFVTLEKDLALKDGKAVYIPLEDTYKEYLTYMKKLFSEGLLDKDIFSQPNTQYSAKAAQGIVGFALDSAPFLIEPNNDGYKKYEALTPLVASSGSQPVWAVGQNYFLSGFTVTSSCKNPEVAVRWANSHFDFAESFKYWFGVEYNSEDDFDGVGYQISEDNVGFHPKLAAGIDGINNEWEYINKYIFPTSRQLGYHCDSASKAVLPNVGLPETEKQWRNSTIKNVKPYFVENIPDLFLTEAQQSRINELLTPINDYVTMMEAKFITGAEPIESFEQFHNQLKKLGAEEYLKIMSDAYEVYKKNAAK